ncbi:RecT family recombinase [Prescottella equi]
MTTELAVHGTTELTLTAGQAGFTDAQLAALRQLGVEDASQGDVDLFFHQCARTGLDPFAKQIYMIGRRTKIKEWNPKTRKQDEKWVMKWTIQTGIDGYRLNGRRAADRVGEKIQTDGPYWQGADGGGWTDVWLDPKNPPAAAKFTIFRDGEAFPGIAMYSEFVQTYNSDNGPQPNSMWSKMPANQLAKCAEAQAWKKAFPDDFSGLVLEDAAQVIDGETAPTRATAERVKPKVRGVAALEEALGAEPAEVQPHPFARLIEAMDAAKLGDDAERKAFVEARVGRDVNNLDELTSDEITSLVDFLANGEPA